MTLLDSLRYADAPTQNQQLKESLDLHARTCTQQNFSAFKIHNIIKAGSLGHGTAVFGNFDVDLVIYSDSKQLNKNVYSSTRYVLIIMCRREG